jgi:enoyl-CoA hydratase/carnithine racemase
MTGALGAVVVDAPAPAVVRLRIDHPARRGALSVEVLAGLKQALSAIPPGTRCLIVTGSGTTFCAGYDLRALGSPPDPGHADATIAADSVELFDLLECQPLPVIAAINGPALGGGLELVLATDVRLAVPEAAFGAPAGRLGLVYSPRGLERILAELPYAVAADLFLAGGRIDAERALALGLVSRLVSADRLQEAAVERAVDVATLAPRSLQANRRALRALRAEGARLGADDRERLLRARRLALASDEFAEGVAAFQSHRDPRFGPRDQPWSAGADDQLE